VMSSSKVDVASVRTIVDGVALASPLGTVVTSSLFLRPASRAGPCLLAGALFGRVAPSKSERRIELQ
jgi:hypothetical protein